MAGRPGSSTMLPLIRCQVIMPAPCTTDGASAGLFTCVVNHLGCLSSLLAASQTTAGRVFSDTIKTLRVVATNQKVFTARDLDLNDSWKVKVALGRNSPVPARYLRVGTIFYHRHRRKHSAHTARSHASSFGVKGPVSFSVSFSQPKLFFLAGRGRNYMQ